MYHHGFFFSSLCLWLQLHFLINNTIIMFWLFKFFIATVYIVFNSSHYRQKLCKHEDEILLSKTICLILFLFFFILIINYRNNFSGSAVKC